MNPEEFYRKKKQELKNRYRHLWHALEVFQESRSNPMILHNFVREHIFQNIEEITLRMISEKLDQYFENYEIEGKIPEIPFIIIEFLKSQTGGDCPFFLGHEIQESKSAGYLCRYEAYEDFFEYYTDIKGKKTPDYDSTVKGKKEEIRGKLRKNEKIPRKLLKKENLRGFHEEFFWACKKRSDASCDCDDSKAQTIVNKLGLILEDDDLVEICIPKSKIQKLNCPTIFDNAFRNKYFRTQYRKDKWGETVDISPNSGRELRGYPESISRSIPIEDISNICIIGGFTRNNAPPDLEEIFRKSYKQLLGILKRWS